MRWRTVVVLVALVALAAWGAVRPTKDVTRNNLARRSDFDCGDFSNRVEAQGRLRRYLNPPGGVVIDGYFSSREERQEAERAFVERFVTDRPKVVKVLDPDGDGLACNRGRPNCHRGRLRSAATSTASARTRRSPPCNPSSIHRTRSST